MSERLRPRDVALLAEESPRRRCTTRPSRSSSPGSPASTTPSSCALVQERISFVPRYRQRVQTVPGRLANPVWVDDDELRHRLPRTPLRAAPPGQPRPAPRAGRADRVAAARPQPAAVGDLLRRGPRRRPGRAALQVAPGAGRRHPHRRPRPGAARHLARAQGARRRRVAAGRPPVAVLADGRRRPGLGHRAGHRRRHRRAAPPARCCAARSAAARSAGRVVDALTNRTPVGGLADHRPALAAAPRGRRAHRPRRLPQGPRRRTAARSTTSSSRRSPARCAPG